MSQAARRDVEEAKRERERAREHQRHLQQLQFNDQGQLSREFLESLIDTSDLQSETVYMMRNYLNRNWMIANLTDAQEHDQRYKLDVMQLKILGMHPPAESSIQGPLRAFLYDDPAENLFALTANERNIIDSFFDTLKAIVTRSREGFERQQLNTSIAESRTEGDSRDGKSSKGKLSLFHR